jgi:RNA polymerase sigma-70 factor (sigma-E family)
MMAEETGMPWAAHAAALVVGADLAGGSGVTDLTALFRVHHAELVRLAALLVRSREAAEDIVQDVFTRVHARRGGAPDAAGALAYLRQAVINGCRSWLRRQAVARRSGALAGQAEAGSCESAEHEVIRAELRQRVLAELAALPARRREVLVLRYYLGLSEAEIARTLGISQGTVKSTAARGIAALARALGQDS